MCKFSLSKTSFRFCFFITGLSEETRPTNFEMISLTLLNSAADDDDEDNYFSHNEHCSEI